MQKRNDALAQFIALRSALAAEREALRKRFQRIDAALGNSVRMPAPKEKKTGGRTIGRRARPENKLNIREAVAKVTAKTPLSVREIVEAVQKIGYRFVSSDPVNSVGAFLYGAQGRKHFKKADGKFSPK